MLLCYMEPVNDKNHEKELNTIGGTLTMKYNKKMDASVLHNRSRDQLSQNTENDIQQHSKLNLGRLKHISSNLILTNKTRELHPGQ